MADLCASGSICGEQLTVFLHGLRVARILGTNRGRRKPTGGDGQGGFVEVRSEALNRLAEGDLGGVVAWSGEAGSSELLVSEGFESPREAGQAVAALKAGGAHAFDGPALQLKGVVVAHLAGEAAPEDIEAALSAFDTEEA